MLVCKCLYDQIAVFSSLAEISFKKFYGDSFLVSNDLIFVWQMYHPKFLKDCSAQRLFSFVITWVATFDLEDCCKVVLRERFFFTIVWKTFNRDVLRLILVNIWKNI